MDFDKSDHQQESQEKNTVKKYPKLSIIFLRYCTLILNIGVVVPIPPLPPARCLELMNIVNGRVDKSSQEKDLIVPAGERITLYLDKGGYLKSRDIIVLGELRILVREEPGKCFSDKRKRILTVLARHVYNFGRIHAPETQFAVRSIGTYTLRGFKNQLLYRINAWVKKQLKNSQLLKYR